MSVDTQEYRLPKWMKVPLPKGKSFSEVKNLIAKHELHTICSSGNCPNRGECWSAGTATFMILGDICTRHCKFCYVKTAKPGPLDENEPAKLAKTIRTLKLNHCVITSVNRDDLPDQGAGAWARTIRAIKEANPGTTMEVLIPDFQGDMQLVDRVINEKPEVISHNLETVRRLTPSIRSMANYDTSLKVLLHISEAGVKSKSGIMLGFGETEEEVVAAMDDLRRAGVRILTIGQYLQPSQLHKRIKEFIHPDIFKRYEEIGLEKGFSFVESGPLVRSSYHAERHVHA
jgi:lipoyl synthase